MNKAASVFLALVLVTGYATAAHKSGGDLAGDTGTGPASDTPNAGKTVGPENAGKPGNVSGKGPAARMKGIQKAITKVPGNVAEFVLEPISNFEPGKALGNALSGVGQLLLPQGQEENISVNGSQNVSQ